MLISALESLDKFCKLASSTKINMTDNEFEKIIASTHTLLNYLESAQCCIRTNKVHVALKHIEPFMRINRCLGNMAEEGIESLHSRFEQIVKKIKRSKRMKVLLYAAKAYAVHVFLFDVGEYAEL